MKSMKTSVKQSKSSKKIGKLRVDSKSVTHVLHCRPPLWVGTAPGHQVKFLKERVPGPVRVGLPFATGIVQDADVPGLRAIGPHGNAVPSQSRILAHWPDGSVHGVLMDFAAEEEGLYEIRLNSEQTQPQLPSPIAVEKSGDGLVRVTTGDLHAELGSSEGIRSVSLDGRSYFDPSSLDVEVVDGEGKLYSARNARNVETVIQEAGPLRTVVAVSGTMAAADKSTLLDFRLKFEFLAGAEGMSLAYRFTNRVPGRDFLKIRAIRLRLKMVTPKSESTDFCHYVYQQAFGLFTSMGRVAGCPGPLRVRVDDLKAYAWVENFEDLKDPHDYPFYLNPPLDSVANWMAVTGAGRGFAVEMDDFHLMRPKGMRAEGNSIILDVWPEWAGELDLQQGRSREMTLRICLVRTDKEPVMEEITSRMTQLRDVWRARVRPADYARHEFFDQGRVLPHRGPSSHVRLDGFLCRLVVGLQTVARFFDLGDSVDSAYRTTYIPVGRRIRRIRGKDEGPRYFCTDPHYAALPLNNLDNFEPVWVNNEYDVIYCLGTEFCRTADEALFKKLRWFARHNIEVDFIAYSDHKWLHRATPAHSERHTSTGAYPSHFWTQGLAQYYLLTGDADALEVIEALADKCIENFKCPELYRLLCYGNRLNREFGWALMALVYAWEITGLKRFEEYALKLMDEVMEIGLPKDVSSFDFGVTTILMGMQQYLEIRKGEPAVAHIKKWLLDFVDLGVHGVLHLPKGSGRSKEDEWYGCHRDGIFNRYSIGLGMLAYAYEITGNEKYIRAGIRSVEALIDSPDWSYPPIGSPYWNTPPRDGKPMAMIYRTFVNFLKPAAEKGYLKELEYRF